MSHCVPRPASCLGPDATATPPAEHRPAPRSPAHAAPDGQQAHTVIMAVRQALTQPGRISGTIVAAAPAVAFVAADALSSLYRALAVAGAVAVAGFGWRLRQRQSLRGALAGLLIVAACAGVAAVTGQERGFFLIPALIPFAVVAVCVVSVLAKRPLTGVILNRISGGPAGWREIGRLRRVYVVSTLVAAAVNVVNAALQTVFYLANAPVVLAAAHLATGPVFAVIVAVTIVFARRAMPATAGAAPNATGRGSERSAGQAETRQPLTQTRTSCAARN